MNFTDKTLQTTLFTNYGLHGITAAVQILVLPIYIKLVGLSEWAYIGYLLLAQSLLTLIDSGLIIGLQRIFSQHIKEAQKKYNALKTLESLMFLMLVCIFLIISLVISLLYYLGFFETNFNTLASIIGGVLIYLALAQTLPHKALLLTNNKQILNNGLTLIMLTTRHAFAILLLSLFLNIMSFILAHLFFALIESVIRFYITWSSNRKEAKFDISIFLIHKKDLKFITFSTILGGAILQIDKLIAATMLNKTDFAKYSVAVVLGVGTIQLFYPIFSTTLPRYLSAKGNSKLLTKLNVKIFSIIFSALIIFWFLWFLLGTKFISIYLGDSVNHDEMFLYISVFLVGSSLYSIGGTLQNNVLSFNLVNLIFYTNLSCLIIVLIGQPLLIHFFDIKGACFGWVIINITIIMFYGTSFLINKRKIF